MWVPRPHNARSVQYKLYTHKINKWITYFLVHSIEGSPSRGACRSLSLLRETRAAWLCEQQLLRSIRAVIRWNCLPPMWWTSVQKMPIRFKIWIAVNEDRPYEYRFVGCSCSLQCNLTVNTNTYNLRRLYVLSKDKTLPVRLLKHSALMSDAVRCGPIWSAAYLLYWK